MGKEKRLFLLAVMTVMMSTAGYGKVITVKPGTQQAITNDNGDTYIVQAGKTGETTIKVNGDITFKDGTGIKYEKENGNSAGKITGTVQKEKTLTITNGTGIDFSGNTNGNDKFNNYGTINVTGGTGIYLDHGKVTNSNQNNATMNISGGTGINIVDKGWFENAVGKDNKGKVIVTGGIGIKVEGQRLNNDKIVDSLINKGEISVSNSESIGISQTNGQVTNSGLINVITAGTGVSISDGNLINKGTGTNGIYVSGTGSTGISISEKTENSVTKSGTVINSGLINVTENGKGINQLSGIASNTGLINVENKGIGIEISGGEFTNTGTGANGVQSSGTDSVGINQSGGIVNNIGLIKAENGATGIKITNGTFNNATKNGNTIKAGTISSLGKSSIGLLIQESEKGTVNINNEGYIKAEKGATGVKIEKGTFTNSGLGPNKGIFVSGAGSIGIDQQGGTVVNDGKIETRKDTIGVKVSNGATFINKKQITGPKGIGVALENGTFINTDEVTIKDAGEIAIKSLGGNNTVYLKNGSKVTGKIVGADGVDVLALEGTVDGKIYNGLHVENYEKISVVNGDIKIGEQSRIKLDYTKDENNYKDKTDEIIGGKNSSGDLVMSNSTLIVDFKDSYTNPDKTDHPIIDVGDGKLIFNEGMTIQLDSSDGRTEFNLNEALGLGKGQIVVDGEFDKVFKDTAIWEYDNSTGEITLKKNKYEDVVLKSQLKDFAGILENKDNITNENLKDVVSKLETVGTKEEFTNAVAQISGGVHGYIVDFAALNARTLTNTMRNRALTRDYMRKRPLNSWIQDISYIDNNHRLGGLMNVDYTEKGVLGISEKQILPNGRLGLVYGGSKGNAKFEGGENGSSSLDGAYFGGYYNHEFNNKWSLNSNANFIYTHNKVTRNVNFGEGENKVENSPFKSTYPTYTVGMGTSLIYTVKDDLRNKAHFYAGVDVERIVVGNINENKNIPLADEKTGLAVKTTSYNARSYYSIVPSAGFMVQNTGYVFDRKYRIGADLNWETEVGNIKDGKRIKLTGLDKEYKVETSERENIFSYSLFGALDLTESLSVNARYTSMFSDEYDADMIGAGFEYKMDTMADNFFGTLAHKLENSRPFSDRWGGTLGIVMETDDSDDYTSYFEGVSSGDVATSMEYKPKITLSLNDKQSNWSYYFEAYHKTNNMFGSIKSDEKESHASRYHGEARWNDTYSKGSYGMSFGYRNENSDKSSYYATYGERERVKTGTHELRITPSFTYDLGHGFTLGGKSAVVFMYKYEGDRAGQMDMNTESQIGITYNGFMPRWSMTMNFYREDTWYDHDNRKAVWKKDKGIVEYNYGVPKRDQVNQLRPSITYYFGNGANVRFDARIPLGNGSWADNIDGTNGSQSYETRYGFNYFYPVTPGLTVNIGGTFLNTKTKNKDHSKPTYGNITKGYNFRPNIGFYYSF